MDHRRGRSNLHQGCLPVVALAAVLTVTPDAVGQPPGPGAAAEGRTVPVSSLLRNDTALVAWVAERHPDIAAAVARVRQAEAGVDVARLRPNPTLFAAVAGMAVGPRHPSSLPWVDTPNFSVGVSQTIEVGKREPRARAATRRRDATHESYRDDVAAKVADARDALAKVVYLRTRQQILADRLESAKRIADLEKVRLQHGDLSGSDYDRLLLDVATVEREVADGNAEYQAVLAECATALIGSCANAPADMDSVDESALAPKKLPDIASAVAARPDVRALRLEGSAAREDATLWRRQAIPDPTVGLAYTHDQLTFAGNQPNTLTVSLSMPIPVFDRGQHQSRVSLGRATELEWQARALEQRGRLEAESLLARRQVLEAKVEQLRASALPRSEAVLKAIETAFQRGGASLTDLLLARREHVGVRLDLADTHYQLFAIRNSLRQVLGLDASAAQAPAGEAR
jgi:outer membrane protein, heavy metal efflux system